MLKKIKQLITAATFSVMLLAPVAVPVGVSAADSNPDTSIQGNLCQGADFNATITTDDATCATTTQDAGTNVNELIADVVNIFSLVVGVVAVIMIIVGGFKYITSGGESSNVTGAKNTILYAIIGLVIVALAQFIVRFVLARVTDAT